jgi:hypothetical protein
MLPNRILYDGGGIYAHFTPLWSIRIFSNRGGIYDLLAPEAEFDFSAQEAGFMIS